MNNDLLKISRFLSANGQSKQANKISKLAQQDPYIALSDKINLDPQFSSLLRARKGTDQNLFVDDKPVILIGFKTEARQKSEQERKTIAQTAVEKYAKEFGFNSVSSNGIVKASQEKYSYNPTGTIDLDPPQDGAPATLVFSFSLN